MAKSSGELDYDFLLNLAREKSTESRAKLTETVLDLFDNKGGVLTERERSLMFGILRSVVRDVESQVKGMLSNMLAECDDAPHDLVKSLATEEIEVAYPLLTDSGILQDEDLIEVVRHRTLEHQLAVAIRSSLSETVSQALVETGNERVIVTLLRNENAKISQNTMEYLVEQSRRVDTFQEPILHRAELSKDLAHRMLVWVSAALREHIVANFNLDLAMIDDMLEKVAEKVEVLPVNDPPGKIKADELAETLADKGMVTPEMLISALRQGEVPLFVALFCRLTGLRDELVRRLLFEPGGEGLAICSKAVGLTKGEFSTLFRLANMVRARRRERAEEALLRILWIFDDMPREHAAKVLKTWRRDKNYLSAIRQLQQGKGSFG